MIRSRSMGFKVRDSAGECGRNLSLGAPKGLAWRRHGDGMVDRRSRDVCRPAYSVYCGRPAGRRARADARDSLPVLKTDLRGIVRSAGYVDALRRRAGSPPAPQPIARPLAGDLWLICVVDRPQQVDMLTDRDLQTMGLPGDEQGCPGKMFAPFRRVRAKSCSTHHRHARPCAGHPRLFSSVDKTWMAGTSPAMTMKESLRQHIYNRISFPGQPCGDEAIAIGTQTVAAELPPGSAVIAPPRARNGIAYITGHFYE